VIDADEANNCHRTVRDQVVTQQKLEHIRHLSPPTLEDIWKYGEGKKGSDQSP
jgi:hypothetical protein